ncbi:MAG TPA: class I SAM-dependent methyltransferase [Jatrophihabitantaceae bacterium]
MPLVDPERSHTNRSRAESFGAGAQAYDRARPSYPPALIDDVLAGQPRAVLDVGCGTGKLARLIAARGVPVLGVEIDERMAEVARAHGIEVEIGGFEAWDPAGRTFDVVVSGQAWHWIDPDRGAAKVAALLSAGGLLVPCWNYSTVDEPVQRRLDAAYARVAPQLVDKSVLNGCGPRSIPPVLEQLRATGRFAGVEHRRYPWDHEYSRAEWVELIQTHSDHSTLPPAQLAELVDAVGTAIGEDVVRARYVTEAVFARTS